MSIKLINEFIRASSSSTVKVPNHLTENSKGRRNIMEKLQYPEAYRDETVVDNYHGVEVPDPYRWLEDPDSEKTKAFVDAQNAVTKPYLESCNAREDIYNRLTQLFNFPKYSCPSRHGDKYYFYKNTGLQNQSDLYVQDTLDSEPRIFFDVNKLSEDGTVTISISKFSEDGSIFAYGLSSSGSDWCTIHFMDTKTGEKYPEVLEKVKFSEIEWTLDNKGIFYSCYPEQQGKTDGSETEGNKNQKLCYHFVGTPQSEDAIVVEFPEEPLWRIGAEVSHCGKWLIVTPVKNCRLNLLYIAELKPDMKFKEKLQLTQVIHKFEADYEYVTNEGSKAIFRTNKGAPNYRLVIIDLLDYAEDKWVDLLSEHSHNVLDAVCAVDQDKFVACYIEDVKNILQLHSLKTGEKLRTFPLELGKVINFTGDKKYSEIFYQFTSFLIPGIIYKVDLKTDEEPQVLREIKVKNFDISLYKTSQIFYTSNDGTKIPMFLVMKKDAVLDGTMPALLYGYGGFNISIQPTFSITKLVFVQHLNGVLAVANIRGGGEYGTKWHNGGRLLKKQNVFDDFLAAANYLIDNDYTTPSKLSILGGSNGGLLVAACANQKPNLFGAVIAQVGVMDMLRFHKFTIGSAWVSDYGSSDKAKDFENLIKYSPLHNVRVPENGQYPATLLWTADHDDRVVPLHSLKFIATLQHTLGNLPQQTNPLLIRIDTNSGHGSGKPVTKMIDESTDILVFIVKTLNIEFKL
ncbi:prolyl endopeptidase isoform X2 [Nomia melanderi]|uniref:prolyl endopeptidase isoform X2 n=1 Tax=Nomia melanderi TaxID=2448451 RepID=UPI001304313B|nr:prolyl endopeptidase isoform X2 [Nomia melanderi]